LLLLHLYFVLNFCLYLFVCLVCTDAPCALYSSLNFLPFFPTSLFRRTCRFLAAPRPAFHAFSQLRCVLRAYVRVGWMKPRECAINASARHGAYMRTLYPYVWRFFNVGASVFHFENRNARNGIVWVMCEVDFPSRNLAIPLIATSLHASTTSRLFTAIVRD